MRKRFLLSVIFSFSLLFAIGQQVEKKPLDHSVYDNWKSLKNQSVSNDGNWIGYQVDPLQGDGWLYLYNVKDKDFDSVARGANARFSPTEKWVAFTIQPQFDTVRQAKLKKRKKDKMPKDSLGIKLLDSDRIIRLAKLKDYKVAKRDSDWLAIYLENIKPPEDTLKADSITQDSTKVEKKTDKNKDKFFKKTGRLIVLNPVTGDSVLFTNVSKYAFSENGASCAFIQLSGDSIDSVSVSVYNTVDKKLKELFADAGFSENISLSKQGNQLAFTHSADTAKNKAFGLYYYNLQKNRLIDVSGDEFDNLKEGWSVSTHGSIFFNEIGDELYFGQSPKPEPEVKDTLTDDEKVSVDIWNWKDEYLQPMQKLRKDSELKRSYTTVFFPKNSNVVQLETEEIENVSIDKKATGKYSLGQNDKPYRVETSWSGYWYKDVYLVNRETGGQELILSKCDSRVLLSPNQQFILWYSMQDSSWSSYSIKKKKSINLTKSLGTAFFNEQNDVPRAANEYGFAGWTEKGGAVVYDKYDLWLLDLSGKNTPVNITQSYGREHNLVLRYVKLNRELRYLPDEMLLSAFNKKSKQAGFFKLNRSTGLLQKVLLDDYRYNQVRKAKETDVLIWRKESFEVYPDLYLSNTDFSNIIKVSNANPQQKEYIWGTVELVDWVTFDGDSLQGLLYKPENFDPKKKYPMLVYFYERYSDLLHRYYTPKPIRSVINFTYYASNGYLIFIPDIKYKNGYPGPSAFNCIISGTQSMCDRYSYIDRTKLGIQGQSWGGYQTAYLITQTDMFAAAMAGAPVSNMTSAYGGIRWGSGMSRAFQYEQTQSRIGGDLWDKLPLYMLNSPLFFAPRVNTPLLMMHNDKDGAVPWYQGIEYFNALRRLQKPVWMLVYNGAPHNLKRLADERDLTRRMQQFFDHFLKGVPEPVWMSKGIPATKKGIEFGFGFE
jgi:dipeptidyl aminopeptidase/acylaminoacyl peptidase